MSKVQGPDLKKFMEKRLSIKLNAKRRVTGTLRGFDQFMNLVLADAIEEKSATERTEIGMVVRGVAQPACRLPSVVCSPTHFFFRQVIRGNSVVQMEALEHVR